MINLKSRFVFAVLACGLIGVFECGALPGLRILNFQADNGFSHDSKPAALSMVESLGKMESLFEQLTEAYSIKK